MGTPSSNIHSSPHLLLAHPQIRSNNPFSRIKPVPNQVKYLSQYQGKLSAQQCIYVLATLMQQYFLLIENKVMVSISDRLCRVNKEGKVFVFSWTDPRCSLDPVHNYVKAITMILEIVDNLSYKKETLWTNQRGELKESIIKHIYIYHCNEKLLKKKLGQIIQQYINENQIPSHLTEAMIKEIYTRNKNQVRQHHRYQSANLQPSFSNIKIDTSVSISQCKENSSTIFSKRKKQSFKPVLSHKITPSEKNSYNYISPDFTYCYSQSQTSRPKQTFRVMNNKQKNKYFSQDKSSQIKIINSKHCFITAQYSITIVSQQPYEETITQFKKPCLKNKRPDLTISCAYQSPPDLSLTLHRNQTQNNFYPMTKRKSPKNQHVRGMSSVLETMARLVEVREINSSKSLI